MSTKHRWITDWLMAHEGFLKASLPREQHRTNFEGTDMSRLELLEIIITKIMGNLEHIESIGELLEHYGDVDGSLLFEDLWDRLKDDGLLWAMNLYRTEDVAYFRKYQEICLK